MSEFVFNVSPTAKVIRGWGNTLYSLIQQTGGAGYRTRDPKQIFQQKDKKII